MHFAVPPKRINRLLVCERQVKLPTTKRLSNQLQTKNRKQVNAKKRNVERNNAKEIKEKNVHNL